MEAWTADDMRSATAKLYKPLRSWQIRLLRLYPGSDNELLQADLIAAGLAEEEGAIISMSEEPASYEAISYCWGPIELSTRILVNKIEYRLNPSLADALRRFRSEHGTRYLWADALCINQCDNDEKSQQVSRIQLIFRKASAVLVWLGNAGKHTSTAVEAMASVANDDDSISEDDSILEDWHMPSTEARDFNNEERAGMEDLCCRPWARRVW